MRSWTTLIGSFVIPASAEAAGHLDGNCDQSPADGEQGPLRSPIWFSGLVSVARARSPMVIPVITGLDLVVATRTIWVAPSRFRGDYVHA